MIIPIKKKKFDFSIIQAYAEFNVVNGIYPVISWPSTFDEYLDNMELYTGGFLSVMDANMFSNIEVSVAFSSENEATSVTEIVLKFTIDDLVNPIYAKYTGVGDSYESTTWDINYTIVVPKEIEITVYDYVDEEE